MAIMLGLSALTASVTTRPDREERSGAAREDGRRGTPDRRRRPATVRLELRPGRPSAPLPTRVVRRGAHVLLIVRVGAPGQVAIDQLGLLASSTRLTPASFDLLAREVGRYDVVFRPVDGPTRTVGALVVER